MRLRDVAITVEDYELWKQHEIPSIDPTEAGRAATGCWRIA